MGKLVLQVEKECVFGNKYYGYFSLSSLILLKKRGVGGLGLEIKFRDFFFPFCFGF